ncbi:helix-turn-helix domain-containing protein [Actinomadura napierensis]|uniref:Helix-turn-helix domain-containing protein n=1 Tax=Actinomadura napierensis TaxID=267854 RepID=A0ABN2YZW1_9ACTN
MTAHTTPTGPDTTNPAAPILAAPVLTKLLYEIPEVMALLSMSRTVIYEQMSAGRLRSVQQGRARRIPAAAILDYVALLETEAAHGEASGTAPGDASSPAASDASPAARATHGRAA